MIASALLAVSVVAVAGVMAASYKQDLYTIEQRRAVEMGGQLMEEMAALPLESTGGSQSLMTYADYTDTQTASSNSATLTPSGTTSAAPTPTTATRSYRRSVKVDRMDALGGGTTSSGKLALVTVDVRSPDGRTVKLRRLVSPTVAAAAP